MHISDKSAKDNMCSEKENLFHNFLDFADALDSEIIILGDFLELWKCKLDRVVNERRAIFDRLVNMNISYVPGNHDNIVSNFAEGGDLPHKFFKKVKQPFIRSFGQQNIKFMHGHEVDPFIPEFLMSFGKVFGNIVSTFEFNGSCILSNDKLCDAVLELGEQMLRSYKWMASKIGLAFREYSHYLPQEQLNKAQRSVRTRKMMIRYFLDKEAGLYNQAIVGHTHKEGYFADWYYNCGSWTGKNNSFLQINEDGNIKIYDWDKNGARENHKEIVA